MDQFDLQRMQQIAKNAHEQGFLSISNLDSNASLAMAIGGAKGAKLRHMTFRGSVSMDSPTPAKLEEYGGTLIARALDEHPELRRLELMQLKLDDEGLHALAPAIARHPNLREVNISSCGISAEGITDFFAEGGYNPRLTALKMGQMDKYGAGDETAGTVDAFVKGVSESNNKNLLATAMAEGRLKPLTEKNLAQVHSILNSLPDARKHGVQEWSAEQIRDVYPRKSAVFYEWSEHYPTAPANGAERLEREKEGERFEAAFDAWLAEFPQLPAADTPEALFTRNDTGFAPVDNPRLWEDKSIEDFKAIPLTAELLEKPSRKGSTLLESALFGLPTTEVVAHLNQQGVTLRSDKLLNAEGKPSALLEQLIDDGKAPALFTADNWRGTSRSEVLKVAEHLPDDQRQKAGVNALIQQISTRQNGLGR